ncbi:MAG: LemA family protein, partial [Limosilactobacillus fermentum]
MSVSLVRLLVVERVTEEVVRFAAVNSSLAALLDELEDKIGYARQFYNDVVLKYNTQQEVFPSNIIAGLFHFQQAQSFEVTDQA